nr:hypothetical protein [Tanacetum cinerariifolium]
MHKSTPWRMIPNVKLIKLTLSGGLGHSAAIRKLTDVNINKLYQSWRSFAAIINKCLTEKSSCYDSLRLSQAQSCGGYTTRGMRNKVNWHYVRDDHMFSTIKLVSRHQNTQQFGALLPIELTNDEIMNSKAYKEYYAIAIGEAAPKPKVNVRRTRSNSDTSITPPTAATSLRLTTSAKGKQTAKASKAKSLSALFEVTMTEAQQLKGFPMYQLTSQRKNSPRIPQMTKDDDDGNKGDGDDDEQEVDRDDDKDDDDEKGGDDDQEDEEKYAEETIDEESFDPIPQTPEDSEDDGDGEEDQGLNIGEEERHVEEEEEDELYRDININ